MNKKIIILLTVLGLGILTSFIFLGWGISLNNQEVSLRAAIEAKQVDNKQQLSSLKNKFKETASISEKEAELLTEAFVKYAEARSGQGGGSFATSVREAVPTIKPETLRNLQNIVESSRNSFAARQTELLDQNRAHNQLLRQFPGNILFGMLGRQEVKVVVVTSEESEKAFESGREESTNLFTPKTLEK